MGCNISVGDMDRRERVGKVKGKITNEFTWKGQIAKRRNKKERAKKGMLLEVKKNIRIEKI